MTNAAVAAVTGVTVSSSAGDDDTYAIGETIALKAAFSRSVTVTTAETAGAVVGPRIAFTLGSATEHAVYASGSGTTELVFHYTVAESDADSDGIAVAANALALNGGAIADGASNAATLTHTALAASTDHTVDGVRPTVSSASVNGTTLTLTFAEALGAASSLANTAFTVKRTRAGTESTVSLSASVAPAISDTTLTLTLAAAVVATDTDVKVSYTVPTSGTDNKLVDAAGNTAADFTDTAVTNASGPAVAVSSSAGTDSTYAIGDVIALTATFAEAMTVTGTPRIALTVGAATRHAAYASGSGTAELVFSYTVAAGDEDTDGIAVGANALALNGGTIEDASSSTPVLTHAAVAASTDHTVDGVRPTVASAAVSGTTLTITFAESLDTTTAPDKSAFTVTGTASATSVTGVAFKAGDATQVELTVDPAVGAAETGITLGYTVPSGDGAHPLEDVPGNPVAAFTGQAVTNAAVAAVTGVTVSSSAGDDDTYAIGETIALKAAFSRSVTVTTAQTAGVVVGPRIAFTLGAATKHAVYASGSGTTELVFHYTVVEGDADSDGIAVAANALALNGGTIADGASNAATLTHTALAADTAHQVDGVRPTVSSAAVSGTALTLTFAEALGAASSLANSAFTVKRTRAGTEATVSLSGSVAPAISGTTLTLTLAAAVVATDTAVKVSYTVPTSGDNNKLVDAAGNTAAAFTDTAVTNASGPAVVVSSSAGDDDTYAIGDVIALTATFAEAMTVTGTPRIAFTLGSATKHAAYASGSGSAALVFSYTVVAGDEDTDGIAVAANALTLNGGTIADSASNTPVLTHAAVAASTDHTVDGVRPTVASASVSGTTLTITFAEALDTTTAPDKSAFTVSGTASATSVTGVAFKAGEATQVELTVDPAVGAAETGITLGYTVPSGDGANPLEDVPGNTVAAFTGEAVTNVAVAAVTGVTVSSSAGTDSTYAIGETIALKATFSRSVTVTTAQTAGVVVGPRIAFTLGSATRHAVYASGSGTTELVFSYTVAEGDADSNGIAVAANALALNGGAIADGASNAATLTHTAVAASTDHTVDGVRPTVSSAAVAGTTLTITFAEALGAAASLANDAFEVKRTRAGSEAAVSLSGTPVISGTTLTLTLAEAVVATDTDVKVSYAVPTSGTDNKLVDAAGNTAAAFTDTAVTNASGPAVAVSSSAGTDSAYAIGDVISLTATFAEAMTVTGTPRIALTVGAATRHAAYASGSGSTELVFHYTVAAGDEDTDGIAVGANALALNGGTIEDASSNTPVLTHAAVAADTAHKVDGVRPTVASASVSGATLTITFAEALDTTTAPDKSAFTVSGTASATSVTGVAFKAGDATKVELTVDPAVGAAETGITLGYTPPSGDGANPLEDVPGNAAAAFTGQAVTNAAVAAVTGVTVSSDAGDDDTYAIGDTIALKATFSRSVTVTTAETAGAVVGPRIAFTLGSATKHAVYASGSGTTELVFHYTVAEGDEDSDGIAVAANALALNGGAIADGASNAATLTHTVLAASTDHQVDGVRPTLASASVSGTTLTLTFAEALGAASSLANSAFTVKRTRAGTESTVSLSGSVAPAISDRTVTLTLTAAVVATDTAVKVSYTVPTTGDNNKLADAAGNTAAAFTDTAVMNASGPAVAVSSSAGTDSTYAIGDVIALTATFAEAMTVTGTPRIAFTLGSATKHAAYASGSGTTALVFRYTVVAGDEDTDGIAVGANALALNGGTIEDASSNTPVLTHAAVAASASHKVDGVRPTLSSAAVSGTTLTLTFNEALGAASSLANSAFTVKRTRDGTEATVSLKAGTSPAISARTVTLTLAAAVTATDTAVKVSYAAPSTGDNNKLVDAAGNPAADFTDSAVTNATGPVLTALAVSSSGPYAIGDVIALKATFNVAVTVDTTGGTPRIPFTLGTATKHAAYASGTGTTELVFHYTVAESDADSDGIAVGANALALNGGAIADGASNAATLTPHGAGGEHRPHRRRGAPDGVERGGRGHDPDHHLRRGARRRQLPRQHGVHGEADTRGHRGDGLLERQRGSRHQRHHPHADARRRGGGDRHRCEGELHRADVGHRQQARRRRRQRRGGVHRHRGHQRERTGGGGVVVGGG